MSQQTPSKPSAPAESGRLHRIVDVMPSATTSAGLFALVVVVINTVMLFVSELVKAVDFAAFGCASTAGVLSLAAARGGTGASHLNVMAGGLLCFAVALFVQYQFPASGLALAVFVVLGMTALAASMVAAVSMRSLDQHPLQEGWRELGVQLSLASLMSVLIAAWLVFATYLLVKLRA